MGMAVVIDAVSDYLDGGYGYGYGYGFNGATVQGCCALQST